MSNHNLYIYLQTFCFSRTELLFVCLPSFYLCSHVHVLSTKNSFSTNSTWPNDAHLSHINLNSTPSWSFLGPLLQIISFHGVLVLPLSWPSQVSTCTYLLRLMYYHCMYSLNRTHIWFSCDCLKTANLENSAVACFPFNANLGAYLVTSFETLPSSLTWSSTCYITHPSSHSL